MQYYPSIFIEEQKTLFIFKGFFGLEKKNNAINKPDDDFNPTDDTHSKEKTKCST